MLKSLKMAFFVVILDSKIIFQNDSKICEAEVTVTPLINKICKPCTQLKVIKTKSRSQDIHNVVKDEQNVFTCICAIKM